MGGASSGVTHDERSKIMNARASCWPESGFALQPVGKASLPESPLPVVICMSLKTMRPHSAPSSGVGQDTYCGTPGTTVYSDNFETATGWTTNPNGTDTATTGVWERGNPAGTNSSGVKQVNTTPSGSNALVTGPLAGTSMAVRGDQYYDRKFWQADQYWRLQDAV